MKQKDIINLSQSDLIEKIKEIEDQLQKMKFTHAISGLENSLSIRTTRRSLARLHTALNSHKNNEL